MWPVMPEPGGTITLVKPRILVVEDEQAIAEPLAESLQREGFAPEVAPTLAVAREACHRQLPDLILLDVMLPDGDGRDLARDIRKLSDVPIIMLTARGEEIDRVLGLELGADDYVVRQVTGAPGCDRGGHDPPGSGLTFGDQGRPGRRHGGPRVRPPPPPHGQRGGGPPPGADHGRGLGSALVRADQDPRRPHLLASQEARGRAGPTAIHHDRPGRGVPLRLGRGRVERGHEHGIGGAAKLRTRLVIAFAYILVTVIIVLEVPLAINLQRRVQSEVRSSAEASALLVAANIGAARTAHPTILQRYVTRRFPDQQNGRVIVIDPDGVLIADSTGNQNLGQTYATPGRPELMRVLQTPEPTSEIRHSDTLGQDILVAAAPIIEEGTSYGAVRVSELMGEVQNRVRRVIAGLAIIGLAALCAGLIVAFALAGSFSRPLTKLAAVAKRLGGGDLSARAETSQGASEIVQLARSFDDMADRLEATVKAQREFVANASHQLRTPLTGMKLRIEAALAGEPSEEVRRRGGVRARAGGDRDRLGRWTSLPRRRGRWARYRRRRATSSHRSVLPGQDSAQGWDRLGPGYRPGAGGEMGRHRGRGGGRRRRNQGRGSPERRHLTCS